MIQEYLDKQLRSARYEIIDQGRRFYAEIPILRGVWAVGKNLEECRQNLRDALEGWIILRFRRSLVIPGFSTPSLRQKTVKPRRAVYA